MQFLLIPTWIHFSESARTFQWRGCGAWLSLNKIMVISLLLAINCNWMLQHYRHLCHHSLNLMEMFSLHCENAAATPILCWMQCRHTGRHAVKLSVIIYLYAVKLSVQCVCWGHIPIVPTYCSVFKDLCPGSWIFFVWNQYYPNSNSQSFWRGEMVQWISAIPSQTQTNLVLEEEVLEVLLLPSLFNHFLNCPLFLLSTSPAPLEPLWLQSRLEVVCWEWTKIPGILLSSPFWRSGWTEEEDE